MVSRRLARGERSVVAVLVCGGLNDAADNVCGGTSWRDDAEIGTQEKRGANEIVCGVQSVGCVAGL